MSTALLRVVGTGLFFLFIFLSGIWLSRSGRPLKGTILTIHKLVGLAAGVFLVVTTYQINQVSTLGATELTAGVVTGLLFVATVVPGALLSLDKPMPAATLRMHQIMPFLTVLSTAVTLYLLVSCT
jgi:predicted cobalt transporter CbtA